MTTGVATSVESEALAESHAAIAEKFFATFGRALFAACQLQYRLAQYYGVSFAELRGGCLPRVDEKIFEGLVNSFGNAIKLAKKGGVLRGALLVDVQTAHRVRDYIAHRLFIETRSLQNEAGFGALTERVEVALQFFVSVSASLDAAHTKIFIDAGIPRELYEAHRKPWDEQGDEIIGVDVPLPASSESIVDAWVAPGPRGSRIIFENTVGNMWQLADSGFAHCADTRDATWTRERDIGKHLPAMVRSRPNPESNPPEFRRQYDYDLRFDNGAIFKLTKIGQLLQYEIVPPRGGKKKGTRRA